MNYECLHMNSPQSPLSGNTHPAGYRGTSLIRNIAPLGPFSRNMPRAIWWSQGGGLFLMREVPLYRGSPSCRKPKSEVDHEASLQGYLAHKKTPTPLGP